MGIVLLAVLSVICFFLSEPLTYIPSAVLAAFAVALIILWVKSYIVLVKQSQEYLKTVDGNENHLVVDEEGFEISNSNSSKKIKWEKIDGIAESEDFVMPLNGKFALICIPKAIIGDETSEFFRTLGGHKSKR